MATKTITIDLEAYRRLKSVQNKNESFSQTIKRVVRAPISTQDLIALFRQAQTHLSEGFFRGVERALSAREMVSGGDRERIDGMLGHHGHNRSFSGAGPAKASRRGSKAKAA